MLTLVFLKLLSDLGIYYSFAGFFALFAGADVTLLLISFGLQALVGFLTYPLRERGVLRFLPLALLAVCFMFPGSGFAQRFVVTPPALYVIYLTAKRLYLPEWSAQVEIFRVFWIALLAFCVLALMMDSGAQLAAVTVPAGLVTLACCVLLMRSLRHDASVYCSPRFQVMNLLTLAGVMLAAAVLSSDVFLTAAIAVLSWIYMNVCVPVIMGIIYLIMGIIRVIIWAFSWIKFREAEQQETEAEIEITDMERLLGETQPSQSSELFTQILIGLGLILLAVILFFIFRWLSRRARQEVRNPALGERTTVERTATGRRFSFSSSPVERVRVQYRKYLKLCRANGFTFEKSETSQEIEARTETAMKPEDVHAMRQIYIAARYHEKATKEDAAEMKRLYQSLAASVEKERS